MVRRDKLAGRKAKAVPFYIWPGTYSRLEPAALSADAGPGALSIAVVDLSE